MTVLLKFEKCFNLRQDYMKLKYRYSNQKHELSRLYEEIVKIKKAVIILIERIKIYIFYKKDESEIIEFCSE